MHSFLHALQRSVAGTPIALLRSLLGSLIVLSLPPGAGAALLQLAAALSWRAGISSWLR